VPTYLVRAVAADGIEEGNTREMVVVPVQNGVAGGGALLAERRRSVVGAGRSAATRQPDKRRVAWSSAEIHSKADTVELRALQ